MRYDLVVIGAGAAGLAAALTGAHFGTVAVVEAADLGGDYARREIPGAVLQAACGCVLAWRRLVEGPAGPQDMPGFAALAARRDGTVARWRAWVRQELEALGVEVFYGRGRLFAPDLVAVVRDGREELLEGERVIVATGACSPGGCGGGRVLSLEEALLLRTPPESAVVVGGDPAARALALALSVWGARVDLVDRQARREEIVPLREAGGRVHACPAAGIWEDERGATVRLADGTCLRAGIAVVDPPRLPATAGFGLEELGVATIPGGSVAVNARLETSLAGVYAAGLVAGALSAGAAALQGVVAAYNACGWPLALRGAEPAGPYGNPLDAYGFCDIVSVG
ncbi:MAG: FAD-dependent oxidoreductase [Bacillota bacterium]